MLSSSVRIMALPSSPRTSPSSRRKAPAPIRCRRPTWRPQPMTTPRQPRPKKRTTKARTRCWCRFPGRTTSKATPPRGSGGRGHAAAGRHRHSARSTAADTGVIGEDSADVGAGWGETVGRGQEALPAFKETAIEDTTTVQEVTREIDRYPADRGPDLLGQGRAAAGDQHRRIRLQRRRRQEGQRGRQDAAWARTRSATAMSSDCAATGPIRKQSGYKLVQLSINAPDKYIGTIALADNGDVRRRRRSMDRRRPLAIFAGLRRRSRRRRISGCSTQSTAPRPATTCRARSPARRSCWCRRCSTCRRWRPRKTS